jgi:hypothetical protein
VYVPASAPTQPITRAAYALFGSAEADKHAARMIPANNASVGASRRGAA